MSAFLTIAVIHLLAVMSPGPDFILVTKNTLSGSKKVGVATAIGLALGILVHVSYSLLGIGLVISKSILLYDTIKYLGAAYLVYIGWKALSHRSSKSSPEPTDARKKELSGFSAIKMGFLCNVLNPKVTLFFLALFTQVINPATPIIVQVFYGLYMSFQTFLWFAFVSHFLSLSVIKKRFEKIQSGFTRIMGAALLGLGVKVALSSRK